MNSIQSGTLFTPIQSPIDLSALSGKDASQGGYQQVASSGGNQAISYGQNGAGGTDFSSLLGNGLQSTEQELNTKLADLLGQFLQQLLPMLQQLLNSQQGNASNAAGSGGSPAAYSGNDADGSGTPVSYGSNGSTGNGTPAAYTGSPAGMPAQMPQQSTGTEGGVTSGTSSATPSASLSGSSGLHLPEALKPYESALRNAGEKTGVPAQVLAGQIWQESRGDINASTVNGGNGLQDAGLMQVNSNTFADLQSKNPDLLGPNASPSNPADSIMAGALYMKEQMNAFGGDIGAALRAYNSGPGNVNINDLTDISKTGTGDATYVDKVMKFADTIGSGNGTLPA